MNQKYPDITRRIYLNAYRYSLHMKDKSTLIELGAQTNTKEEIYNSIEILAEIINDTVTR
jgi:stage II sporulation protein P